MAASPYFPGLPADWTEEIVAVENGKMAMRVWSRPYASTGRGLFLVHGFGEQSSRYLHFPHYFGTCVDVIAALDLPGHGLSKGQRGHCDRFEDIETAAVQGFAAFRSWLAKRNWDASLHWMGHSFGGLITLAMMGRNLDLPLRSVIVSAPLLGLALKVPRVKKIFGELIAPVLPRLPLKNEIDASKLSRDPSVGDMYSEEKLNHSQVTPRMFLEMNRAMDKIVRWPGPLPYSSLLILPLNDEVVQASLTFRLWREWLVTQGKRKELSTWPGASHEAFNDWDKARVFNAIESWIVRN